MPGVVIVGAGRGIGLSVARRFAREGMPIALVARSENTLRTVGEALATSGVPVTALKADSADAAALRRTLDAACQEIGVPDAVVYNAAIVQPDLPGELSVRAHQDAWAVNAVGAVTAAAHVVPAMIERGGGSFIVTGGMPEPKPEYVSLSLGKAGLQALVTLLDKHYGPAGIHVATVTVDGTVTPGTALDPDLIAEHYWTLHAQPRQQWEREIVHADHDHVKSPDVRSHDEARVVVTELLNAWQEVFNERRTHDIVSLFTKDTLFQGIDSALMVDLAEISAYYERVPAGTTAAVELLDGIRLDERTVGGFAEVTFSNSMDEPQGIRLSVVARHVEGNWQIRQCHAARTEDAEQAARSSRDVA